MTARFYNPQHFIDTLTTKTGTPVLMIQTEGSCASSLRYNDIQGMPEGVIGQLQWDDLAFVTFDSASEATAAFDTMVANFPQSGETTLSITAILGIPGRPNREFQQIHGEPRSFKLRQAA